MVLGSIERSLEGLLGEGKDSNRMRLLDEEKGIPNFDKNVLNLNEVSFHVLILRREN